MKQVNKYYVMINEEFISDHFTKQEAELQIKQNETSDLETGDFEYNQYQIAICEECRVYSADAFKCVSCEDIFDSIPVEDEDNDKFCQECWDERTLKKIHGGC